LHSWWQFDAENVLLHEITKGRKSYAVRKFVHDLTQVKILHGNKRAREEAGQRVASQARLPIIVAPEEGEEQFCVSNSQAPKPCRQPSATAEDLDQGTARGGGHGEDGSGG
jgi:hypothetical protein